MDSLQKAISDVAENMEQIENDLDRYLDIFKRFQAEQKLDEIQKRLQQLLEQQNALNEEISNLKPETESSYIPKICSRTTTELR